ncbi:unnamed protein product [Parnassius apollo]|uniref:ascorbate ferrireductase (transmembrane) n=1 Tax=Parnassius apollo TaxID=110799 RepID=A0A8S3Y414_PARAO|nr:unnamed protein product [Parnassius apollo]
MTVSNENRLPENVGQNNIDQSLSTFLMNLTNTLTQFFLGAVAFSAIYFVNIFQASSSLKQHVYLCVTGYIILMSQAILSLNPYTSWTKTLKHADKKIIHWVMQITGSVLAIAGSIIRIIDVQTNFTTAHGIVGLVAMIFTFFSLVSGLVNLIYMQFRNHINLTKIVHSVLGSLAISTAYICLCLGFHDLYRNIFGDKNANISIVLAAFALIGTLTSACTNIFRRIFS